MSASSTHINQAEAGQSETAEKALTLSDYFPENLNAETVRNYIRQQNRERVKAYEPHPNELTEHDSASSGGTFETETTYMSFGGGGTTATVTGWGQFMQITRYLGAGSSSMFTIDHGETAEPFYTTSRANNLQRMERDKVGFGPDILFPTLDWKLTTQWLHNMWPRMTFETDEWRLEQQWVINDGVVIEHLRMHNLSKVDALNFLHVADFDFLIRELDFIDEECAFNKDDNKSTQRYVAGAGPGGYGYVKIHQFCPEKIEQYRLKGAESKLYPDAVAVVMGFFINGEPWEKNEVERELDHTIPPEDYMDLVVAYKLVLLDSKVNDWKVFALTESQVDINLFLQKTNGWGNLESNFRFGQLISNYFVQRNVDHILSVCMMPISAGYVWDYDSEKNSQDGGGQIFALTCGDLSGHRVCPSASYFAFKFLLEVAEELQENIPVRRWIKETCWGHLQWVFTKAEMWEGKYLRNYWVNGKTMPHSTRLPSNGPTDTPFQILKAYEYYRVFEKDSGGSEVKCLLNRRREKEKLAMRWIKQLNEEDARNASVWHHMRKGGVDYYRLDDHAWIWRALFAVSIILDWTKEARREREDRSKRRKAGPLRLPTNSSQVSNIEDTEFPEMNLRAKYEPEKVRQDIIRRFTTLNEDTKQQMIAVTRSPQESRFEFHSRDTALFYPLNGKMLFDDTNSPWMITMEAQQCFPPRQDTDPGMPLRYGLSLLLALCGVSMSITSPNEVRKILSESVLMNGLFPTHSSDLGEIDSATYQRDYYLHIPFEVSYILWSARKNEPTVDKASGPDRLSNPPKLLAPRIPFNDQLDERSIVQLKEEWMYNYPVFLRWYPDKSHMRVTMFLLSIQRSINYGRIEAVTNQEVIGIAYNDWFYQKFHNTNKYDDDNVNYDDYAPLPLDTPDSFRKHWLVDVRKKKPGGKKSLGDQGQNIDDSTSIKDSWEQLCKLRTADNGKKRFIWFLCPPVNLALMCYLSSPPSEQPDIVSFLDRHSKRSLYCHEKTSRILNVWETEFHCSFLQLPASQEEQNMLRCPMLQQSTKTWTPRYKNQELLRASASFRFLGDFFDRFWTCHFLEDYFSDTVSMKEYLESTNGDLGALFKDFGRMVWQQRRVLEPLLFYRVMNEVNKSTSNILQAIYNDLHQARDELDRLTPDQYFQSHKTWASWNEVLDTLSEDLDNILETVTAWRDRESRRRGGTPRWTKRDEIKYRDAVQRIFLLSESSIRDFRVSQAKVASLQKSVTSHRETTTAIYSQQISDRNFRQNNNIKYFTYSTVFFLPLSFATSFFSMQDRPSNNIIREMIICTFVAFTILLVVLTTLPATLKGIQRLFQPAWAVMKGTYRLVGGDRALEKVEVFLKERSARIEAKLSPKQRSRRSSPDEEAGAIPNSEKP